MGELPRLPVKKFRFVSSKASGALRKIDEATLRIAVDALKRIKDKHGQEYYRVLLRLVAVAEGIDIRRVDVEGSGSGAKIIKAVLKLLRLPAKFPVGDVATLAKRAELEASGVDLVVENAYYVREVVTVKHGKRTKEKIEERLIVTKDTTFTIIASPKLLGSGSFHESFPAVVDLEAIGARLTDEAKRALEEHGLLEDGLPVVRSLGETMMLMSSTHPLSHPKDAPFEALLTTVRYANFLIPLAHGLLLAPHGTGKSYATRLVSDVVVLVGPARRSLASAVLDKSTKPPKPGFLASYRYFYFDEAGKVFADLVKAELNDVRSVLLTRLADGTVARDAFHTRNPGSSVRFAVPSEYFDVRERSQNEGVRRALRNQFVDRLAFVAYLPERRTPRVRKIVVDEHGNPVPRRLRATKLAKLLRLAREENEDFVATTLEGLEATDEFPFDIKPRSLGAIKRFARAVAYFRNVSDSKAREAVKAAIQTSYDMRKKEGRGGKLAKFTEDEAQRLIVINDVVAEVFVDELRSRTLQGALSSFFISFEVAG